MMHADMRHFLRSATARLTASYLAIIMLMSLGFSVVLYNASYHELGRQVPPPDSFGLHDYNDLNRGPRIHEFFQNRIDEGRHELLLRLLFLNLFTLLVGAVLSYYLARRTLKPIEANMEAQSQFVSDASHELRTPLTALQTTNEVALRKNKLTAAETKDILVHNVAEVVKLRRLTDNLLNLARADDGIYNFVSTDLSAIVGDAINIVLPAAQAKNIAIDDQTSKFALMADKANLAQAVATILDNAIKYSPAKSQVQITAVPHGKHIWLSIRDQGSGIDPEHLPHIFDRFYRVDAARNKQEHEGFGIGLALAQKIAEQHGGEIIAESTPGQGSTFTLKLPANLASSS